MPELVRRREDPALHRNPVPGVDHHRGSAVALADAQPEERVPRGLQEEELDPVVLQEPADVPQRLRFMKPDRGTNVLRNLRGSAATHRSHLKPERTAVVQLRLEPTVRIQPFRDHRQDLLPPMNLRLGPKPHALQRPNRCHQLPNRHGQRRGKIGKGARPWDDRPPLDLPQRHPRDPGPGGQLPLRQLPVQP